jgi:predicted lipoprotein with Yx(FWY)xxD motif
VILLSTRLNTTSKHIIILNYSKNYGGKSDCTKIKCNRNWEPFFSSLHLIMDDLNLGEEGNYRQLKIERCRKNAETRKRERQTPVAKF